MAVRTVDSRGHNLDVRASFRAICFTRTSCGEKKTDREMNASGWLTDNMGNQERRLCATRATKRSAVQYLRCVKPI